MRKFYQKWPKPKIIQIVSEELSHEDHGSALPRFPLYWSHYVTRLDLNYARAHWTHSDENPPVGLIHYAEHRAGVARSALEGLSSKMLPAKYRTALPCEETLAAELKRTRQIRESRTTITPNRSEPRHKPSTMTPFSTRPCKFTPSVPFRARLESSAPADAEKTTVTTPEPNINRKRTAEPSPRQPGEAGWPRTCAAGRRRCRGVRRANLHPSRFRTEWWEGTFKIRTSLTESNQD
jgi:hypothetical protein